MMAESIEVMLVRMEGKVDRVSGQIDDIKVWTKRQDDRLNHHSGRITILEQFKSRMKGIGIAAAFVLAVLGILASF